MLRPSRELRATAFILEDVEGRERGGLSVEEGEPRLRLIDESGNTRVLADISEGNPRLLITDANGVTRLGVDCYEDGPSFFMNDGGGDLRIGIDFSEKVGEATIAMADGTKKTKISLRVSGEKRSSVTIWGADNTIRAHLQVDESDSGSVLIAEAAGKVGFVAGAGTLMLLRDGEVKIINTESDR